MSEGRRQRRVRYAVSAVATVAVIAIAAVAALQIRDAPQRPAPPTQSILRMPLAPRRRFPPPATLMSSRSSILGGQRSPLPQRSEQVPPQPGPGKS